MIFCLKSAWIHVKIRFCPFFESKCFFYHFGVIITLFDPFTVQKLNIMYAVRFLNKIKFWTHNWKLDFHVLWTSLLQYETKVSRRHLDRSKWLALDGFIVKDPWNRLMKSTWVSNVDTDVLKTAQNTDFYRCSRDLFWKVW